LRQNGYPVTAVRMEWLDCALGAYMKVVGSEAAWVYRKRIAATPQLFQPETLNRLLDGAQVPAGSTSTRRSNATCGKPNCPLSSTRTMC
jgi:hypothetical protein